MLVQQPQGDCDLPGKPVSVLVQQPQGGLGQRQGGGAGPRGHAVQHCRPLSTGSSQDLKVIPAVLGDPNTVHTNHRRHRVSGVV